LFVLPGFEGREENITLFDNVMIFEKGKSKTLTISKINSNRIQNSPQFDMDEDSSSPQHALYESVGLYHNEKHDDSIMCGGRGDSPDTPMKEYFEETERFVIKTKN
jgi:hypothetical protein